MRSLFLAALLGVATLAAACTVGQIRDAALVGAHGKLLDAEFEAASIAVTSATELTEDERAALWRDVEALDAERVYLRTILERPAGEQVVAAATACQRIEAVAARYSSGKRVFLGALDRAGTEPPITLRQYDSSAELVYDGLHAQACDEGSPVQAAALAGHIGLGLRVIAAMNGVPGI